MKTKHNTSNLTGYNKSSSHREIHSCEHLYNKEESSQINNWSFHLDKLKKEEQTKPKATREKEMIKIKVEINHVIENINKT